MSTIQEPDCGSSSCIFSAKGGMRTNGPCRCMENAGFHGSAVMAAKQMLREVLLLRAYLQRTQPRLAVKAASTPVVITQALDPGIDLGPPVIGGIKNPHADMGAPSPRTRKAPAKKAKAKR